MKNNKKIVSLGLLIIIVGILICGCKSQPNEEMVNLKLYFANENATQLVAEEREVALDNEKTKEEMVLDELIIGPKNQELYETLPKETVVLDIKIDDDKLCTVNLNEDFVNKHNGGSTGELFTVYSIVNSLCELDSVDKVKFLIEGETRPEFKGHMDFSKIFSFKMIEE